MKILITGKNSFIGNSFQTVILRIPMVYEPHSKGNFQKLENIANKLVFLPNILNQRSVLNIENLNHLGIGIIKHSLSGVYYPQDKIYFNIVNFIKNYRLKLNKKTLKVPFIKIPLFLLSFIFKFINKVFVNKYYDLELSVITKLDYQNEDFTTYINKK